MHTNIKKIKKSVNILITFLIVLSILITPVYAADFDDANYDYALKLKELGVFVGTDSGFELSRVPTRIEGVIMLVRLLGKENEALSMANDITVFTDVPSWANGYVNYAKSNGLTNGVSDTLFGSNDSMSAQMYVTFLLRSLGYDDTKGDFYWEDSLTKANSIGMIDATSTYTSRTFIRSHVARLSYNALVTLYKNSPTTLAQYLVNIGALNEKTALAIDVIENPAIINGKLYALKDTEFYDLGENDCYVDVIASASIANTARKDVYVHKGDVGEDSKSLLNIPIDGYSTLIFRVVHENGDPSNMLHIFSSDITTLSQAQSSTPLETYSITDSSKFVSIDLTSINSSILSLYVEAREAGTIYIYNLYLQ